MNFYLPQQNMFVFAKIRVDHNLLKNMAVRVITCYNNFK